MIKNKIVNTVWLGGNLNTLSQVCIHDWKKKGYEVIVWSDKDSIVQGWIDNCIFAKKCYERKLYAFVSDYIRLKVLELQGGWYLDTDVTIVGDLFEISNSDFIIGKENENDVGTAVIYASRDSIVLKKLVYYYESEIMLSNLYIGPKILTWLLSEKNGFSSSDYFVMDVDAFYSYHPDHVVSEFNVPESAFTVHWFNNSWSNNNLGLAFLKGKNKGILGKLYEIQKQIFRKKRY